MTELNTAEFRKFKPKREAWIEWLSGKDRNSIKNQIMRMIWDAAVFRIINEARRIAPKDGEGEPTLNPEMHGFINRSFFEGQASAIRRLMDRLSPTGIRACVRSMASWVTWRRILIW